MALKIKSKQIKRMFVAYIRGSAFTANGTTNVITTALSTVVTGAGDLAVNMPVQVAVYNSSVQTEGFVTTTPNNKILVYDATTKKKIDDGIGGEVYATLTEAGGVYTISYFKNDGTTYTFTSTSIDFEVGYLFEFHNLPYNFGIAIEERNVDDDPDLGAGKYYMEIVTPTGSNTLPNLSKTPIDGSLRLIINTAVADTLSGSGLTHAGKVMTWNVATTGFEINSTDRVIAQYQSYE